MTGCKHPESMIETFYAGDEVGWECHACDDVLAAEPYWALAAASVSTLRAEARRLNPDYPGQTAPGRLVERWEKENAA